MQRCWALLALGLVAPALAQVSQQVVNLPTRPGVTQRMLVLTPPAPKAAVVLLAGGHGGLQMYPNGSMRWGEGNFLVRTRALWADQGLMVAVVDAPSDRQSAPWLGGFRQEPEHAADLKAVIAWLREQSKAPVWLVGTSRGTQSAAYVTTELQGAEGPDGLVLSATILSDDKSRAVPEMPLGRIRVPVLVVHHEQDGCALCAYAHVPALMGRLSNAPRKAVLPFTGGQSQGDPCAAQAYHGFNGIEGAVVQQTAAWMLSK
ncbi:MAG: alpha/beta hydrolase [Burkholderiales bacterium]|nr:alpha/beta hydrolase [Burkholderiales bacterium]